jgi:hypothetical protein
MRGILAWRGPPSTSDMVYTHPLVDELSQIYDDLGHPILRTNRVTRRFIAQLAPTVSTIFPFGRDRKRSSMK